MVFSSVTFLFHFLPTFLLGYFLAPKKVRNAYIALFSLVFYSWGNVSDLPIILFSMMITWLAGMLGSSQSSRKGWTSLGIIANLAMLAFYKYKNFILLDVLNLGHLLKTQGIVLAETQLPIGISFFTFQAISYLVTVYSDGHKPLKNPIDLATYITCFPQLIAGPIVRFETIAAELKERSTSLDDLFWGGNRFAVGLFKKIVIANTLGKTAELAFSLEPASLSVASAWLGMVCYSFQIFFDFSGYSDMAIGLGRIMGFSFPENFRRPYTATSVTDFWRRWHITLSSFFKDFVYIPLGGNRGSSLMTYRNLGVVFFLTGLWHGASWNFIVWGFLHGACLIVEKLMHKKLSLQPTGLLGWLWTMLVVIFAWVFFRSPDLTHALQYIQSMLGLGGKTVLIEQPGVLVWELWLMMVAAAAWCFMPSFGVLSEKPSLRQVTVSGFAMIAQLYMAIIFLSDASFNPFIYYRF